MGVNFTPIVDNTISTSTMWFTMGMNFKTIVNAETVLSTMGVKFTPIVDNSAHEQMGKIVEIPS